MPPSAEDCGGNRCDMPQIALCPFPAPWWAASLNPSALTSTSLLPDSPSFLLFLEHSSYTLASELLCVWNPSPDSSMAHSPAFLERCSNIVSSERRSPETLPITASWFPLSPLLQCPEVRVGGVCPRLRPAVIKLTLLNLLFITTLHQEF